MLIAHFLGDRVKRLNDRDSGGNAHGHLSREMHKLTTFDTLRCYLQRGYPLEEILLRRSVFGERGREVALDRFSVRGRHRGYLRTRRWLGRPRRWSSRRS